MSLRTFLRTYREEIDRRIREIQPKGFGGKARYNEEERRMWVNTTASLRDWARSLGVKL